MPPATTAARNYILPMVAAHLQEHYCIWKALLLAGWDRILPSLFLFFFVF